MEDDDENPFVTPRKWQNLEEEHENEFVEPKTAWKIRSSSPLKPLDQSLSDIDACSSVDSNVSERYCWICFEQKDDTQDLLI